MRTNFFITYALVLGIGLATMPVTRAQQLDPQNMTFEQQMELSNQIFADAEEHFESEHEAWEADMATKQNAAQTPPPAAEDDSGSNNDWVTGVVIGAVVIAAVVAGYFGYKYYTHKKAETKAAAEMGRFAGLKLSENVSLQFDHRLLVQARQNGVTESALADDRLGQVSVGLQIGF